MAKYCVLKDGTVYNFDTKRRLKPFVDKDGYLKVGLYPNNKHKFVHRLVSKAYIFNPDDKPCINHIDGNKHNNDVSNLEWVTKQENNTHACKTGLKSSPKVCWNTSRQLWQAKIQFKGKIYRKASKDNKQLVEDWLEAKRKEFYPCS